jgi:hypothetical protein
MNNTPEPISQLCYFVFKYAKIAEKLAKIDTDAITLREMEYMVAQCLSLDLVWTKESLT